MIFVIHFLSRNAIGIGKFNSVAAAGLDADDCAFMESTRCGASAVARGFIGVSIFDSRVLRTESCLLFVDGSFFAFVDKTFVRSFG